jgi:tetratricopeptide (TPR) repeat protein
MQQLQDGSSSALAEQVETLHARIETTQRRLNVRQRQAAIYGVAVEPSIVIEIEDLERQLADLNQQLGAVGGNSQNFTAITHDQHLISSLVLPDLALPDLERPPTIANFIGRTVDLAAFAERLASGHIAVVVGSAGIGKTALAAELARRTGDPARTFWHTFHAHEGIDGIVWRLAGFLARHSHAHLLCLLHSARRPGGQAPPPEMLFDFLLQAVRGRDFLICLDDFQFVDNDPLLDHLSRRLHGEVIAGALALIVTSRRMPSFVQTVDSAPLAGLSSADARRLLETHGLMLNDDLAAALYARTEGNPQLLILAIDALRRVVDPARLIDRLTEAANIERYLMRELDARLADDERAVMGAVAALLGFPATRDAIDAMLEQGSVRRTLSDLAGRHLLAINVGELGNEYRQHAIIQSFYYGLLGKRERTMLHLRAGTYYESEELDPLRAARHFAQIDEHNHAARLLTGALDPLIGQGHARPLLRLLNETPPAELEPALRLSVNEARGDLQYLLGDLDGAIVRYGEAIAIDSSSDPLAQARLHRKLGDVLARRGRNDEALASLDQARALLVTASDAVAERARLAVSIGTVLWSLGRYDEAAMAQAALDQLGDAQIDLRVPADLHDLVGKIHYRKGDLAGSIAQFQAALGLRQRVADQQAVMKSYSNLAVVYNTQHRDAEALHANQAALEIAERIGDTVALSVLYTNLSLNYQNLASYDRAITFGQQSLVLRERMGDVRGMATVHGNIGEIYRAIGRFELAIEHLTQAIKLSQQVGDQHGVISGTITLAQVYLTQGRNDEALAYATSSFELSRQTGEQLFRPWIMHTLGCSYGATGWWNQARAQFEGACRIWRERKAQRELYDTLLEWARLERNAGQSDRARELGVEAVTLARLTAADDLIAQASALVLELDATYPMTEGLA